MSPIDLIPDFVPILGYLDDLLIMPLGIVAVLKLMPPALLDEHRTSAAAFADKPVSRAGVVLVLGLWLLAALALWLILRSKL
jgi:uncharacterized membrane protein YkvA (DUF1232 family)